MSSKFLTEEKKCEELLNLYNFDKETFIELIDFFILVIKIYDLIVFNF